MVRSVTLDLVNQNRSPSGNFALKHLMQIMSLMLFALDYIKGSLIFAVV